MWEGSFDSEMRNLRRDVPDLARELGRYPVTLKKGAPDVDSEPYPIYGTEEEQEAWCIHHQDDVWGWAIIEGNNDE